MTLELSRFERVGDSRTIKGRLCRRLRKVKTMKSITAIACAIAMFSSVAIAAEKKSCCDKAKEAGKECTHPCCVDAKKAGKTCEKCNPKKEEKK